MRCICRLLFLQRKISSLYLKFGNGQVKLIYLTPERLTNDWFISFLYNLNISLFVIDEAHCVSHWGHDFRPEYQRLSTLAKLFPKVPRLALTATADYYTKTDILHFAAERRGSFSTSLIELIFIMLPKKKIMAKSSCLIMYLEINLIQE